MCVCVGEPLNITTNLRKDQEKKRIIATKNNKKYHQQGKSIVLAFVCGCVCMCVHVCVCVSEPLSVTTEQQKRPEDKKRILDTKNCILIWISDPNLNAHW